MSSSGELLALFGAVVLPARALFLFLGLSLVGARIVLTTSGLTEAGSNGAFPSLDV